VNFTREPIIETVITPREGCKLVVRSSKGNGQEDYYVDAVEVVSFGHSFFFRSTERPKSFLVPVSDYEILELRETRMVLKNVSSDRSLKIGGGRDAPMRPPREASYSEDRAPREEAPEGQSSEPSQTPAPTAGDQRSDRNKRDRRRRGRRGGRDRDMRDRPQAPTSSEAPTEEGPELNEEPTASAPEEQKAPSFISKLFPPPSTLIKETLSRYKMAEPVEGTQSSSGEPNQKESLFEHPKQLSNDEESDDKEDKLEE
jgi:hypothetical protein